MAFPKHYKLTIHEQSFSQDDVVIYKEDGALKVGDIVEVYHPDGDYSRLLVQIKHLLSPAIQQKGHISINSSLASSFHLRQYNNVIVNHIADVDAVTLDVLELVFKDQFVTRSDTWRLHRSLIGSCVYFCNKVTFTNMRVYVNEMWMKGAKVACGVVGESTKIVYRSVSAKFHIFVQMSAEMWEFDHSGDLYFEKAIMGFLQDLFSRWKDETLICNHNVVIVLFSRTYYKAHSIDEFSKEMQKEVLCSRDGRYYRDFYKIIKQSEKQDDLQNIILEMKSSFHGYPLYVGCQQPLSDEKQNNNINPKGLGMNSRADKGNLLEAINLSLNVFETLYIDCNLEETNCTALVITPSTGVFEVNEELTWLTKNRLIENGVRVDLVCLAEQPLHSVPLLKFITSKNGKDDIYNVPQWINLSYYSKAQSQASVFVPRMQVPLRPATKEMYLERITPATSGVMDYDAFDAKVFDYSNVKQNSLSRAMVRQNNVFEKYASTQSSPEVSKSVNNTTVVKKLSLHEEANIHHLMRSISEDQGRRALYRSYDDLKFTMATEKDNTPKYSTEQLYGDSCSCSRKQNILNPFKPQHMANAITLFKYRWLDILNLRGKNIEDYQEKVVTNQIEPTAKSPSPGVEAGAIAIVEERKITLVGPWLPTLTSNHSYTSLSKDGSEEKLTTGDFKSVSVFQPEGTTAAILTRVDWKSLCMPACLPLTINYFPDENVLRQNYNEYHYTMIMEDLYENMEKEQERHAKEKVGFDRSSMPPDKKFMEMISQRIGQGFQFVTKSDVDKILKLENASTQSMEFDPKRDYVLSMGNIIHHLKLVDTEVDVTLYSLREPFIPKPVTYQYNLWPHNLHQYSVAQTEFSYELAAKYNWNNLDRYICETEFNQFNEQMKYWRTRFLLLPIRQTPLSTSPPIYDSMQQIEAFLKFLEGMNKIKRGSVKRQLFIGRKRSPKAHNEYCERLKTERRSITPDRSDKKESAINNDKKTSPLRLESQELKDIDFPLTPRPASFTGIIPDDMPPEHCWSIKSPLQDIIKAMLNPHYGLHFLPPQEELRENTFISAEAVAWMMKSIDECYTKKDAVQLGQRLLEDKCIIHASESVRQSFIDGFFLYYIKEEKKEEETEKRRFWFGSKKSEEELLKSYNIQWLEAAVWRDENKRLVPSFLEKEVADPDILTKMHETTNTACTKDQENNTYKYNSVPLYKSMEYNLEADQKSKRSEWCTLFYHGNYYPNKCAYSVELNWMVATCSIIADLVQKWSHKGTSCGVHVVPAPMCVFPSSNTPRCFRNPLRGSPFIHLNIDGLLKEGQTHLFESFDVSTWSTRMFLFHEAVLHRFDFLRDITRTAPESIFSTSNCKVYQYIHSSGSILMKINNIFMKDLKGPLSNAEDFVDSPFRKNRRPSKKHYDDKVDFQFEEMQYKDVYGFFWVYNWALSKKWQSSYTGDVASSKRFVQEVSDFCANKDDRLVQFWQDACDSACNYVCHYDIYKEIGEATQDTNVHIDINDIN